MENVQLAFVQCLVAYASCLPSGDMAGMSTAPDVVSWVRWPSWAATAGGGLGRPRSAYAPAATTAARTTTPASMTAGRRALGPAPAGASAATGAASSARTKSPAVGKRSAGVLESA